MNQQKRNSDDSGASKGLLEILERGLWEYVLVVGGQAVCMGTDAGTNLVVEM